MQSQTCLLDVMNNLGDLLSRRIARCNPLTLMLADARSLGS
jgi:hypothetical protein